MCCYMLALVLIYTPQRRRRSSYRNQAVNYNKLRKEILSILKLIYRSCDSRTCRESVCASVALMLQRSAANPELHTVLLSDGEPFNSKC